MTRAVRSPGSALKPFLYAIAFDEGIAAPETLVRDAPRRFGGYLPENFDRRFHGDVTLEDALRHSLNLPAVATLERIGAGRFQAALTRAGARRAHAAPRRFRAGPGAGAGRRRHDAGGTGRSFMRRWAMAGEARPLVTDACGGFALHAPLRARGNGRARARNSGDLAAPGGPRAVAAGAERAASRVQDRHVLRLSRCVGVRRVRTAMRSACGWAGRTARRVRARPGAAKRCRSCSRRSICSARHPGPRASRGA